MTSKLAAALLVAVCLPAAALADDAHHKGKAAPASTAADGALSEGEVRRVDKDAKKLTIRHGPIQNLDMPAMTMVFQVKDPALLDRVKAGDQVKFAAEKEGAAYVVTRIEPAK